MEQIIKIYLENKTEKANRLGVHRQTLNAWMKNPKQANINLIENDLRELLQLIEDHKKAANAT